MLSGQCYHWQTQLRRRCFKSIDSKLSTGVRQLVHAWLAEPRRLYIRHISDRGICAKGTVCHGYKRFFLERGEVIIGIQQVAVGHGFKAVFYKPKLVEVDQPV